ncbi:BMP family lipoprotein [Cohnella algarum]|uniref:BMP family lipoprotein n=1 Tax=Cohnella algarum TaxID=2044859 RepID=UPI0019678A09|nr:BMP family ABC transporter substrate-binding protein [Cohnella algarum]MBN2984585.1 BMP family ABC transporter substrate-binding protein [Cohnella algarum]
MKLKLKIVNTLLILAMAFSLAACGSNGNAGSGASSEASGGAGPSASASPSSPGSGGEPVKVGLLTGTAGLGDKSFNDLANEGAQSAATDFGIDLKVVEPGDLAAAEGLLRDLAKAGNELIFAVGFDMVEPLTAVANEYPDKKFAVIDAAVDLPNVRSLMFKEHEGSFLVGALAAMMTETNKIGTIPAMDVPFLNRFTAAYEQGAKYVNPDIEVLNQPIGSDNSAFNDPGKMKNIALSMYSQNVDIIYPVAGGSGTGLFEAAKEQNKYAFGINSDQDDMAQGLVLTSMLKRVDTAVYDTISRFVGGHFEAGLQEYGLSNNGIGLTEMKYTKNIIGSENIGKLSEIQQNIMTGEIEVIDITAQ